MGADQFHVARDACIAYYAALRRSEGVCPYQDAAQGTWGALWAIERAQKAHIEAVEALSGMPGIDDPMAALAAGEDELLSTLERLEGESCEDFL